MAFAFPLPTSDFWDWLPIDQLIWDAPENVETGMTGRGETIAAELAPQVWQASVTLGRCKPDETARIEVMLSLLRKPGRPFFAYDRRRPFPGLDPRGLIIDGATVTLASVPSLREVSLSGLPARFPLSIGDYLAFSYSGGRRALHRVAVPVTANDSGVTTAFEVAPMLSPGATVGAAVSLTRAACAMQIVPNSVQPGPSRHGWSEGTTFRAIQTLAVLT